MVWNAAVMAFVIAASVNVFLSLAARPVNVPILRRIASHPTATKFARDMEHATVTSVNASLRNLEGSAKARRAMKV